MKVKSLLMIILLFVGCSAAFGQTFTFADTSNNRYCDGEIVNAASTPYIVAQHDYVDGCGYASNVPMVGFAASIPLSAGAPAHGAVWELADASLDFLFASYTGCQVDWVSHKTASTRHVGWAAYETCDGITDSLVAFGDLLNGVPARAPGHIRTALGIVKK